MQFPVTNPIKTLHPGEELDAATSREPRSSVRRILKGDLLHLYIYSIVCCWRLSMSNFQLIRLCSESAAPPPRALCVWGSVRNAMGMPWPWWSAADWHHWKRPTEVSEDRVWSFKLKRHSTTVAHGLFCWHSKVQALCPHGSNCKWSSKDEPAIPPL